MDELKTILSNLIKNQEETNATLKAMNDKIDKMQNGIEQSTDSKAI